MFTFISKKSVQCVICANSTTSYGGLQPIPFQGSCQGNGASPAMWLIISLYLVLLMKEQGHTSKIKSPITGITLTLLGFYL